MAEEAFVKFRNANLFHYTRAMAKDHYLFGMFGDILKDMTGILHSYKIKSDGSGERISTEDIASLVKSPALGWVHLNANDPATRPWLMENIDYLDSIVLDALLADETRPRIMPIGEGVLLILRGMNLHENAEPEDMISIRLWIDPHRIVSIQRRQLKAVEDICEKLEAGNGPKEAAGFLAALTDRLFKRMEPTLLDLDEQMDGIEEKILEGQGSDERRAVVECRRRAIILRRYILPQKDVLASLRLIELPWITQHHKRQFQEDLDRVTRFVEDLDSLRERAQIVKEEISAAQADKMNRNMYVLTIVAAIFLPLGFLTGLLGINVGGMPGAEYDGAFWLVCAICLLIFGGLTGLLRFLKWI